MLLNCGVGEDSWESLGLQRDPTSHPKGDQSWVFIGRTDVEAETPILWPPDVKSSLEKTLMLGKIESRRRSGWQRRRWLDGITDSMDMGLAGLQELVMDRKPWFMGLQRVRQDWATELNWIGWKQTLMIHHLPETMTLLPYILLSGGEHRCCEPQRNQDP